MVAKGVASQAHMFLTFVFIDVLLKLVDLGGGFTAISNLLSSLLHTAGPAGVMIVASLVGGFGIEAAAVAEIKIIADMFKDLAVTAGLPMGCFGVVLFAATRLTGSAYPNANFVGQMGVAQSTNTKEALKISWTGLGVAWAFVFLYAFIGPMILK